MSTLYRKYRPSVFADVVGQETTVQTLQNEIANDKLAHAYLFSGPRGVGKTTLARLLAKAVSCEKRSKGKFEPCNECSACKQINDGRHIDIIEIDAASQTGVDNVRENIIENSIVMPTILKYKVFIIDEVHMLSTSAFNALLKTLEEPPAHVIFILATTELHKLPATVVSRCQRFTFKKIAFEKMLERLKKICGEEKVKVDKIVLERIVRKSEGGLRDAESLLGQILSLNLKEIAAEDIQMILPLSSAEALIQYVKNLVDGKPGDAIKLVNVQAEEGTNLDQFAHDLLEMLRAVLLIQMRIEDAETNADYSEENIKEMRKISTAITEEKLVMMLDLTLKRRAEIRYSPIPQLPLELLAVEMALLLASTNSGKGGNSPLAVPAEAGRRLEGGQGNVGRRSPQATLPSAGLPSKTSDHLNEYPPEPPSKGEFETPTSSSKTAPHPALSLGDKETNGQPTPTPRCTSGGLAATTLEQIKTKWNEIIEKAAVTIPSLIFILKMCTPQELKDNVLLIAVPYSLHKEKMEASKNRLTMETCLHNIFSERIRLAYTVVQPEPAAETDVSAIAADFGGEVVG